MAKSSPIDECHLVGEEEEVGHLGISDAGVRDGWQGERRWKREREWHLRRGRLWALTRPSYRSIAIFRHSQFRHTQTSGF